jgi:cytochrome oxidase Cu insertion factor (SCO1/SenC/PrrC family)
MPKSLVLIAVYILSVSLAALQGGYPKPQVASAVGKQAPDFALKDENGSILQLSDQRGRWVLLYFYRGYW